MIQTKDPNMIFFNEIGKNDCELIDAKSGKFSVFGLYDFFNRDDYVRMPPEIPGSVSENLFNLNQNTSGGRVCFITDSDYIGVDVELCAAFNGTNMSGGGARRDGRLYFARRRHRIPFTLFFLSRNQRGYEL